MKINKNQVERHAARRGMVVVLFGILLPVLVGTMALALDGGILYFQRRSAQTAADAAALAGAYNYSTTASLITAQLAAEKVAASNGFTITSQNVTQPSATTIAVTVTSSRPRFFSRLWSTLNVSISATATATINSAGTRTPYSTDSLILLDPSMSQSLYIVGATISASGGIQVNSTSSTAVVASQAGTTGSNINVVGNYATSNGGTLTGTLHAGASSVGDPFASMAVPAIPSTSTTNGLAGYAGYGAYTLQPGLYPSGLSLGNGGTFTMEPGLYYIQSSNGLFIGNGVTLTGSGVTIYMDTGGSITFGSGSSTTLTAPGTSPVGNAIQGVVYFQNRTSTVAPTFYNGTTINLTGTFYAAKAALDFAGGTHPNLASQVVADSMYINNGANVSIPYSSSVVASKTASYVYPIALTQ